MDDRRVVVLDVGGTLFKTTVHTLCPEGQTNYFHGLFQFADVNPNDPYFIDRERMHLQNPPSCHLSLSFTETVKLKPLKIGQKHSVLESYLFLF